MTEAEWLACTDPQRMLEFVNGTKRAASRRKLQLFACACVRRIWNDVIRYDPAYCMVMAEAERRADGQDSSGDRERFAQVDGRGDNFALFAVLAASRAVASEDNAIIVQHAMEASKDTRSCIWEYSSIEAEDYDEKFGVQQANDAAELVRQCNLIRDLFGNPFRRVPTKQGWRKPNVVEFASMLYDNRALDCLPGLADALESAGCKNNDILQHCRQPGEHVRGCWVVDLILGKE